MVQKDNPPEGEKKVSHQWQRNIIFPTAFGWEEGKVLFLARKFYTRNSQPLVKGLLTIGFP